ncbi:excalibur calcium-binding domain-containing protein [Marilutibacter alkalisoli]|uniref:excalibur calcium-binding domain-containing protein n=1 Tax=Marilutibacter alkalisoli TaxID=2591633 RepID=UPI001FC8F66D|nr:excalibur calcium-binding domain-containing protein [Lysobacter alkalisoli]
MSAWAGILIIASQLAWPHAAAAHGGGLNAQGCHNDRKNGGYHCHRSPAAPKPPAGNTPTPTANRLTGNQSGQVYYANCSAARAAGAAPVRRGDPGYGRHLDRDGDGVGCE